MYSYTHNPLWAMLDKVLYIHTTTTTQHNQPHQQHQHQQNDTF